MLTRIEKGCLKGRGVYAEKGGRLFPDFSHISGTLSDMPKSHMIVCEAITFAENTLNSKWERTCDHTSKTSGPAVHTVSFILITPVRNRDLLQDTNHYPILFHDTTFTCHCGSKGSLLHVTVYRFILHYTLCNTYYKDRTILSRLSWDIKCMHITNTWSCSVTKQYLTVETFCWLLRFSW